MSTASRAKSSERQVLSISQLNRQAKRLLEGQFPSVWVEGEISNLARPSSGHWYFSLKDNSAQVRCAMFRSSNARLRFAVEAGQQVMARAKLSLYEARGDYQLIVEHMEPAGDGALAKAFEALKAKLLAEGLFDQAYKQPLPTLARHIAVVTSATGAAIHDILTVLDRRFPGTQITILPVAVQGKEAGRDIANAIQLANQLATNGDFDFDFDVILTGRGGGSLEDLWAFNEEIVARAIFNSELPVVSAVGHEVDITIADFVADVRAPTPSAAAELLSPDQQELAASFTGYEQLLQQSMLRSLMAQRQRLGWLQKQLKHPGSRLQEQQQRLDELEIRLINITKQGLQQSRLRLGIAQATLKQHTPLHRIQQCKQSIAQLYRRLEQAIAQQLTQQQQQLRAKMQLLHTVSPLATLERGYAIVSTEDNEVVRQATQLKPGQRVTTRLGSGQFSSRVEDVEG